MGELIIFPRWRVITRDEGSAPGDPVVLIDPRGRRIIVEEVLRSRLVAPADPGGGVRREVLVRAGGGTYLAVYSERTGRWEVLPGRTQPSS
ncbi:MAG: hypothetical protein D6718_13125 [Acidobacteria bacterium]|nr:MAG: hypothetical protein D6718_13125 [Acidobacteriota bacterium]